MPCGSIWRAAVGTVKLVIGPVHLLKETNAAVVNTAPPPSPPAVQLELFTNLSMETQACCFLMATVCLSALRPLAVSGSQPKGNIWHCNQSMLADWAAGFLSLLYTVWWLAMDSDVIVQYDADSQALDFIWFDYWLSSGITDLAQMQLIFLKRKFQKITVKSTVPLL